MKALEIQIRTRAILRFFGIIAMVALMTGMTCTISVVGADLQVLRTALQLYRTLTGVFPTTAQGLSALVTRPVIDPRPKTWRKVLEREKLDPWGNKYVYKNPGERNPEGYDLFCMGADRKAGTSDDVWQE